MGCVCVCVCACVWLCVCGSVPSAACMCPHLRVACCLQRTLVRHSSSKSLRRTTSAARQRREMERLSRPRYRAEHVHSKTNLDPLGLGTVWKTTRQLYGSNNDNAGPHVVITGWDPNRRTPASDPQSGGSGGGGGSDDHRTHRRRHRKHHHHDRHSNRQHKRRQSTLDRLLFGILERVNIDLTAHLKTLGEACVFRAAYVCGDVVLTSSVYSCWCMFAGGSGRPMRWK